MKIFILFLIIAGLVGLYFMMKSERFYKPKNYMGIFFIALPILFIALVWFAPFIKGGTGNETATLFQFIQEASTFAKSSRLYLSLTAIIIWMFLLGYMQVMKYTHGLAIYIVSILTSLGVVLFIIDMIDTIDFVNKYAGNIPYTRIGIVPFLIIAYTIVAYIFHSVIYIKKYAKK